MSGRQLNGRLRHTFALRDGLLRQQSAQRPSDQVAECRTTMDAVGRGVLLARSPHGPRHPQACSG
jgi:hypothetical protein